MAGGGVGGSSCRPTSGGDELGRTLKNAGQAITEEAVENL